MNRILLQEILGQADCIVTDAKNGKEALDFVETQPFDLVLMDIEMPEMNGIEATKLIRANEKAEIRSLKVFAITAHDVSEASNEIDQKEIFDGFISKPFTLDSLLQKIRRI